MIQGYYFSRPLPEQDAVKLIRSSLEVLNESI
jgi:EAL domain-containing protein (putative c-di-GMP-specific phosphodiesterase class I)